MEDVKKVRRQFLKAHADDLTDARLMDKHKCALAKVKEKERSL